jgi:YVTN family beta-propeller protein
MNVGITPTGIAITPDSKYAYVANNNNYGLPGQYSVTVLDLETNLVIETIYDKSFFEPYTVTLNKKGTKAYVTNSATTTVSIIDTKINKVIGIIEGFDGPSGFTINHKTKMASVNNYGSDDGVGSGNANTVRVVDLKENKIIGPPIIVGLAPAAIIISPNKKYVYTANYVDGEPNTSTISKISTKTNTVIETIGPFLEDGLSGIFNIALSPNGKIAYVTNFGSNNFSPIGQTVTAINLYQNKIIKNITVGLQPAGLSVSLDGKYALITNYNTLYAGANFTKLTAGQGTVNVICLEKYMVVDTIRVGQSPGRVVISPNGKYAYVSNYTGNTVDVIKINNYQ